MPLHDEFDRFDKAEAETEQIACQGSVRSHASVCAA